MYAALIIYMFLGVVSLVAEELQLAARSAPSKESDIQYPLQMQDESLLIYERQGHSQFGEEGILEEILHRLDIKNGFFVEFGGWDGSYLSNTRFLADAGWSGAFIEADKVLSDAAEQNCKHLEGVQCINAFVVHKKNDSFGKTLDQIADEYFPEVEIDVLSIDIDGADYLILETLKRRPKIIIIEGGQSWSPWLDKRVPDFVAKDNRNQPLAVIFKIAHKKGYRPVCYTINTFLVREDLMQPFVKIKNDPVTLWFDSWYYYQTRFPGISKYVLDIKKTDPWIQAYDPYELPNPL